MAGAKGQAAALGRDMVGLSLLSDFQEEFCYYNLYSFPSYTAKFLKTQIFQLLTP